MVMRQTKIIFLFLFINNMDETNIMKKFPIRYDLFEMLLRNLEKRLF